MKNINTENLIILVDGDSDPYTLDGWWDTAADACKTEKDFAGMKAEFAELKEACEDAIRTGNCQKIWKNGFIEKEVHLPECTCGKN